MTEQVNAAVRELLVGRVAESETCLTVNAVTEMRRIDVDEVDVLHVLDACQSVSVDSATGQVEVMGSLIDGGSIIVTLTVRIGNEWRLKVTNCRRV